jgi:hypothetical protein
MGVAFREDSMIKPRQVAALLMLELLIVGMSMVVYIAYYL